MAIPDKNNAQFVFAKKYTLNRLIGWGAHGEVYQAKDIHSQDTVAVKIFFSSREQVSNFVYKELNSISRLSHPNLLPFKEFGECDWKGERVHYIVTPFIEGGNLALLLQKKGAMSVEEALGVVFQVVKALSYMHSKEHLHRDIKPANILLDGKGNAILADFSISCSPENPATGPVGTPEYSSPEQMSDAKEQHPRIDIYCLGITLYEMLCNVNPFREIRKKQGQAAALQSKYLENSVLPLAERDSRIPFGLSAVVQKMMHSVPEKRYQNMEEVRLALMPFFSKESMEETNTVSLPEESDKFRLFRDKALERTKYYAVEWWDNLYMLHCVYLYFKRFGMRILRQDLSEEVGELFAKAQKLRGQSRWKESLKVLRYVGILDPLHIRAINYQGDTLVKLKRYRRALCLFDRAILQDPKYYSAYCHRGFVYSHEKNFDRGIRDYDVAIALEPDRAEAYFYRARTFLNLTLHNIEGGNFQKASEMYQNVQTDLMLARKYARQTSVSSLSVSSIM